MHELVIRGGTVVDGSGAPAKLADVGVSDGTIDEVGRITSKGHREIDVDGALVMPGIVDIHTHYDAQICWDPLLTPSTWHGVTTVVMGNCGVGFAPAAPDRHEWLIGLMEGVEDIPGAALQAGIPWQWETFPEYLDYLDSLSLAVNVGAQVPHGPVRAYVMGERGANNDPATSEDIDGMYQIVKEAIASGALGFSTTRTEMHKGIDGRQVPGTFASEDELLGICRGLGELRAGIIELITAGLNKPDLEMIESEMVLMHTLAACTGRPLTFLLNQLDVNPSAWRNFLEFAAKSTAEGLDIRPQVAGRSVSVLIGLQTTFVQPFRHSTTFQSLGAFPRAELARRLRDPEIRRRVVAETEAAAAKALGPFDGGVVRLDKTFPIGNPVNYEPDEQSSIAAIARRQGRSAFDVLMEVLLEDEGRGLALLPVSNFSDFSHDVVREMHLDPTTVFGLSDGGAHCGAITDAGISTWMLTHWGRDRSEGRFSVEALVKMMAADTAATYGMSDRGVIKAGKRADLNIVDFPSLALERPELVFDLPTGAPRFIQRAQGWLATLVAGETIVEEGVETGARPGHLVRGAR